VRVYTGINQKCPQPEWWGETSTEFMGAEDIHLEASLNAIRQATTIHNLTRGEQAPSAIYDLQGRKAYGRRPGLYIKSGKKYIIK